jgi:hypothetical protein
MIKPFVVKIATPRGYGTGFIFTYAGDPKLWGIATAAHVIREAHVWYEPIRIEHPVSGKSIVVRSGERGVQLDLDLDTAFIVAEMGEIPFPGAVHRLIPKGFRVKVGDEMGWVGFPALEGASGELCFFSGKVSAWLPQNRAYLVDGVAIHGVSGGPAFVLSGTEIFVVGVVSAYHPHRLPGETWPGLCVVRDVMLLQTIVERLRSLAEAKKQETPRSEVQVPPPAEAPGESEPGGKSNRADA